LNFGANEVEIGSAVNLTHIFETLNSYSNNLKDSEKHKERALKAITEQLHWFSGTPIR